MPRPRSRLRLVSLLATLVMLGSSVAAPVPVHGAPSTVRLVVTFHPGTPPARAEYLATATGGTVVGQIDALNVRVVDVPAVAAAHARGWWNLSAEVASVETDGLMRIDWLPTDPLWSAQWEQRQVRTPRAWDMERGAFTTVVAVVDTGVQLNHPDLEARLVGGYDFVHDDNRPRDDNGHGTSVAGIVAASANSVGVVGTCNRCRIMPLKALAANGTGYWSDAAEAIIWAADHHADVINLSFGGPSGGSTLQNAIDYARAKGAVVVAAAGNFGISSKFYPAAMTGVISVAGSDSLDLRKSWSNYSTGWVDLAAPGCTWAPKWGSSWGEFCGTSAATPIVSGIAGLVDAANPSLSRAEIERILFRSTINMPFAFTALGRIDAYEAVYRAIHGQVPSTPPFQPVEPPFDPPADVTFLAGEHAGYRFDTAGAIVRGAGVSLPGTTTAHAYSRSTIPGRAGYWYAMTDGALGTYWVAESDDVFLTPEPTPTPTPTPTPSATTSPAPIP